MVSSRSIFYRTVDVLPSLAAAEDGKIKSPNRDGGVNGGRGDGGCKDRRQGGKCGREDGEDLRGGGGVEDGECPLHVGDRAARWRLPARYRVMLLLVWGFAVQMALRVVLNVTIISMETPAELTPPTGERNLSGSLRLSPGPVAVIRPELPWSVLLPVSVDTPWTRRSWTRLSNAAAPSAEWRLPSQSEELESKSEVESESESVPTVRKLPGGSGGGLQLDSLSRGLVLSSFYWGYMVSQVPGGRLVERLGARPVLGASLGVTSLLAMLLPPLAEWAGATGVISVRLLQGLATGPVQPSLFPLLAQWLPSGERQTACALITAAQLLAVAAISPAATSLSLSLGWQSVHYVTGAAGLLWLIVWWLCMYDSPAEHPAACACELRRIAPRSATTAAAASPPYGAMLRSAPVWAIVVCEVSNSWGQTLLLTLVPFYLQEAVGLDLRTSGLLNGVPFIGRAVLGLLLGLNGDLALRRGWLKLLTLRRLATAVSCGGVSVCLLALPLTAHLPAVTATLFCLAGLATAFTVLGHPLSTIDVSPTFCGTVFGLANTLGGVASLLSPLTAGAILDRYEGAAMLAGWRFVFWLAAAVYALGLIGYLVMASADRQTWDADSTKEQGPDVKICPTEIEKNEKCLR